jgi:hypothetical protein
MSTDTAAPATWPDFAESLYEKLTGRGTEISYRFENLTIEVPRDTSAGSPRATWLLDGALHISTAEKRS